MAFQHVKRYTPITLTRRKDIERDLEESRTRGYAINRGEFRVGVCGIAVPVRDRTGGVVAAIGLWGAEKNILGARQEDLAQLAASAARDVSQSLGYIEPDETQARARPEALEVA
jgi:IclR family acetate operon transcriptional repressor